jgi:hypothetical protein
MSSCAVHRLNVAVIHSYVVARGGHFNVTDLLSVHAVNLKRSGKTALGCKLNTSNCLGHVFR